MNSSQITADSLALIIQGVIDLERDQKGAGKECFFKAMEQLETACRRLSDED